LIRGSADSHCSARIAGGSLPRPSGGSRRPGRRAYPPERQNGNLFDSSTVVRDGARIRGKELLPRPHTAGGPCDGDPSSGRRRALRHLAGGRGGCGRGDTRPALLGAHRPPNVLNKDAKSQQSKAKRALGGLDGRDKKDAIAAFDAYRKPWGSQLRQAVECIKDRDGCLAFTTSGLSTEALRTTTPNESSSRRSATEPAHPRCSLEQGRAPLSQLISSWPSRREKTASPRWPTTSCRRKFLV